MRILHTADWHLGDRLGRIDRTADIRRSVETIGRLVRDERADVLIIAGDLFSELSRADGLRDSIRHLQDVLGPYLLAGGTVLAITGNHDNENFCRTLCLAMDLAAPAEMQFGAILPPGRFYLAAEPTLVKLAAPTGSPVQFVMMPYPTPSRYLVNAALQGYQSLAQKQQFLQAAFGAKIDAMIADPAFDPTGRAVLIAHGSVLGGAEALPLFRIDAADDVPLEGAAWSKRFNYVALGHIHKAMSISGHDHIRYSGSIERLDLGESLDRKGALLVELPEHGPTLTPRELALSATPVYHVRVERPTQTIPQLAAQYPDHAEAVVNIELHYRSGEDSLEQSLQQLAEIFPRWYNRQWFDATEIGASTGVEPAPTRRFDEVVRGYVDGELVDWAEADRARVLGRLERLLNAPEAGR